MPVGDNFESFSSWTVKKDKKIVQVCRQRRIHANFIAALSSHKSPEIFQQQGIEFNPISALWIVQMTSNSSSKKELKGFKNYYFSLLFSPNFGFSLDNLRE